MSSSCLLYRLISLLMFVCLFFQTARASAQEPGEHQIKAAMTYNMLRFMDWPDETVAAQPAKMTICVVGKGQLGSAIAAIQGKTVKNKIIHVQQLSANANLSGCDVLLLSEIDRSTSTALLDRTRSAAMLTVSDASDFARNGGVVGFVVQQQKVRFEINQAAAQRHRLRISAQLLKLAQIVTDAP